MENTEPEKQILEKVERNRERIRPLKRLLLLDVMSDKESRPVFYWAGGMLLAGVLVYHWIEGWSYLDALYFCVVSLATVGYGDFTPTTPLGRLFTIFYLINGIAILLALFDRLRVVRARAIEGPAQTKRKS
jgi:voltage-gated potassium channel